MQASRGVDSLLAPSPHSTVLRRRHEVCNPLVSTHRMEVGVGVVVEVVVSRADLGFQAYSSRHRKAPKTHGGGGAVGTACGHVRLL